MLPAPPHILVIDDNEEILQIIGIMLTRKRYTVSLKNRMTDFESEIKNILPDLVLLDKNLGWADGCNLCKLLKAGKDTHHIPVLMLSAYHKTNDECIAAGADGFIQKPFEINDLLKNITLLTSRYPAAN